MKKLIEERDAKSAELNELVEEMDAMDKGEELDAQSHSFSCLPYAQFALLLRMGGLPTVDFAYILILLAFLPLFWSWCTTLTRFFVEFSSSRD